MLDLCIRNGSVLNGTGAPAVRTDVGVMNGRIVAMGDLCDIPAGKTVDAAGKTVCPGFLDMHRHADAAIFRGGYGDCDLFQGVTTIGNGNCGLSIAPLSGVNADAARAYLKPVTGDIEGIPTGSLSDYHEALKERPMPVNAMMLAGGGTIRATAVGFRKTRLGDADFKAIHRLLEQTLRDGAGGVSLGLGYAPECFYSTDELIRALEPIRGTDVVLSAHTRSEAMHLLPSIDEMITVAEALHVPLQISHLKATGRENWHGLAHEALRHIARAKDNGLDAGCDVYSYTAGSTQLLHILPPEFLKGGPAAVAERLKDAAQRRTLMDRLKNGRDFDNYSYLVGWDGIFPSSVRNPEDAVYIGKSIAEAAGSGDPAAFALDLLARNACEVTMIDRLTCEDDIATILKSPFSYVISDATFPSTGKLHPRVYGAFANVIETYVRKKHALTLPEAIQKMTLLPAERYGLTQKGRIAVGADADILVFDPTQVRVNATFEDPERLSDGMDYVFVNGQAAVERGVRTNVFSGTVLSGK